MAIGTAAAIIGGSLLGGAASMSAANKAAKAQQAGVDAATGEQRRQFDITQGNLAPSLEAGNAALEQQRILLGLGGTDPNAQLRTDLQSQLDALGQESQGLSNSFGGSTTGRAGMINRAGQKIISGQDFGGQRTDLQSQLDAIPEFTPGSASDQQQAAFDALNESPGQQFLRDRAQKNLIRNSSAIGGLGGGNVRSALVQQGVGFAQQDLQNQFGRLGQLAGQGQSAATSIGQFGQNTAQNIGNLAMQSGNIRASGIQQGNQILQQGLGGLFSAAGQSGILNGGSTQFGSAALGRVNNIQAGLGTP